MKNKKNQGRTKEKCNKNDKDQKRLKTVKNQKYKNGTNTKRKRGKN